MAEVVPCILQAYPLINETVNSRRSFMAKPHGKNLECGEDGHGNGGAIPTPDIGKAPTYESRLGTKAENPFMLRFMLM